MGTMLIIGMGKPSKKGNTHMNPMEQYMNAQNADLAGSADGQSPNGEAMVEDDKSGKKTGQLTFNKPSGFKLPEGVKDGEPFDAMATLKMENGKLVLHELDGAPVEDEHESDEDADKADEASEDESEVDEDKDDESETPEGEGFSEDKDEEPEEGESDDESDSEPRTKEQDANDEGEPEDFLSAIERGASKKDEEKSKSKKKLK
jgi:hypothetical protein